MVEEVKKLKMKIVDFNKKQMKERIEKIKVETEKRIAEGNVQNIFCVHKKKFNGKISVINAVIIGASG